VTTIRFSPRSLFLLLAAGVFFGGFPPPGEAVERLNIAQVSHLPSRTFEEVSLEFQRMRRLGFDTVALRVFHNRGDRYYPFVAPGAEAGVYFATDQAPVVADILTPLIPLARAAGLRVFAWAGTLRTPLNSAGDLRGRRFDLASGQVLPANTLDPFHPEVRRRLQALFADLARYDLDGILLQDDLALRHTEGFSATALAAYRRCDGRLPDPEDFYRDRRRLEDGRVRVGCYSPSFYRWSQWKCRVLMDLAAAVKNSVRQVDPDIRLAFNLPYEILFNPQGALAWFSLDLSEVRKTGFEYLGLMLYHRQMAKELGLSGEQAESLVGQLVARGSEAMASPEELLVKLQAVDFDSLEPIAPAELERVARIVGERPVSRAWFPYSCSTGIFSIE
jgi:poly-beta-1,6-N-acetyl-D-glucosamine N-deacetylase